METTIEVAGLRKRFGRTLALDGMTFTVSPGQVTGFIGPNGAGKSTTMRVTLGLDAPDAGHALVGGRQQITSASGTGAPTDATATFDRVSLHGGWPGSSWTGTSVNGGPDSPYTTGMSPGTARPTAPSPSRARGT
jgi:ABC-type polysaccharide/polyol phosphate transport system ATPase subunit